MISVTVHLFLNRQKLVSFINSTQNQRYKNINKIIGFDQVDEIETTLKKVNRRIKNEYASKTDELNDIIAEIEKTYDCDIENAYDEVNKVLKMHDMDLISQNTDLKEFIKDFSKNDYERKTQLKELNKLCDINISNLDLKLQKLLKDYEEVSFYQLKHTSKLLNILDNSCEVISKEKLDKCPVCQSDIEYGEVLEYINLKKDEFKSNSQTIKKWNMESKDLISELNDLKYKLNLIKSKLNNNYSFDFELDDLIDDLEKINNFEIKLSEIDKKTLTNLNKDFLGLKNQISDD